MITAIRVCEIMPSKHLGWLLRPVFHFAHIPFLSPKWKAKCLISSIHDAPVEACRCGLYSVNRAIIKCLQLRNNLYIDIVPHDNDNYYSFSGDAVVIVRCLGKTVKHKYEYEGSDTIVYRSRIQVPQVIYLPKWTYDIYEKDLSSRYDCDVKAIDKKHLFENGKMIAL